MSKALATVTRIPLNDMLAESLSSGVRLMSLDELKASRRLHTGLLWTTRRARATSNIR